MMEASKKIDAFLTFLRECEQRYKIAQAEETEADGLTQDILHSLELDAHTYHEYAALAKELRAARQARRTAKDTVLVLEPVIRWMSENRAVIKSLERMLGDARKQEKYMECRTYTPRVRKQAPNTVEKSKGE